MLQQPNLFIIRKSGFQPIVPPLSANSLKDILRTQVPSISSQSQQPTTERNHAASPRYPPMQQTQRKQIINPLTQMIAKPRKQSLGGAQRSSFSSKADIQSILAKLSLEKEQQQHQRVAVEQDIPISTPPSNQLVQQTNSRLQSITLKPLRKGFHHQSASSTLLTLNSLNQHPLSASSTISPTFGNLSSAYGISQFSSLPRTSQPTLREQQAEDEQQAFCNQPPSPLTHQPKGFFADEKGNLKQFSITFSTRTRGGQYSPNLMKVNQDATIIVPTFPTDKTSCLFAVCDGHGEYGHLVSSLIKKQLPKTFARQLKAHGGWQNSGVSLQKVLTKSFSTVSQELLSSKIDTHHSGSTTVAVLIHDSFLWCANCGDSRAIIGREVITCISQTGRPQRSEWKSIPLSEDHKPDLPRERKRIIDHGGRVEKSRDESGAASGVFRVWNQSMVEPGLAMARSFGDKSAREVGVVSEPEIFETILKEEDKFVVLASDGVWEFLTNADVVKTVIPFYRDGDHASAAEAIIKQAVQAWQKHDDNVIDDITCVVVFFKAAEEPKKRVLEYI